MTLPGNQNSQSDVQNAASNSSLDTRSVSPSVSPQSSPRPVRAHKRDCSSSSSKDSSILDKNDKPDLNSLKTSEGDFQNFGSFHHEPNNVIIPSIYVSEYLSCDALQVSSGELSRSNSQEPLKDKRVQDRIKKKAPWYSALYPTYKSRSDDFKRIFKEVPQDERLVVDYSCALQRDILVHGRLYISQNYLCFYANIFRWETQVVLKWKDVTAITKEKTALVIPNAILVLTNNERHFITSFTARDKAYLMLFRVWQHALMDKPMTSQEVWQWVHTCYGEELGLTSDDDDYIPPTEDERLPCLAKTPDRSSAEPEIESVVVPVPLVESVLREPSPVSEEKELQELQEPPCPASPDIFPTDLSDSSPSESESEKQVCSIVCPVAHEGKLMLHMQVSIHVDQLFTLLFTNSKFFFDLHENRKSTDVRQSGWEVNPSTNQKGRTVSLTVEIAQAIGPKHAQVTESQRMLPCSKPGEMYVIEIEVSNAGIPYADSFFIASHYCLIRGADPGTSTIAVYCQIKYRKTTWTIVKNFIEKNCWSGLEEYYSSLVKALEVECERTRRAMASGVVGTKRKLPRRRRSQGLKSGRSSPSPPLLLEEKPLIQPLKVPTPPPSQTHSYDPLSWLLFIILLFLLVVNAALYYKLWGLEQADRSQSAASTIDIEIMRELPKNEEEWRDLLQRQEQLHSLEMERWLSILKASNHLLQQVEESLSSLQASIRQVGNKWAVLNEPSSDTLPSPPNDEL